MKKEIKEKIIKHIRNLNELNNDIVVIDRLINNSRVINAYNYETLLNLKEQYDKELDKLFDYLNGIIKTENL